MQTKLQNLTVKDLMHSDWISLSPNMSLNDALKALTPTKQNAAAVVNKQDEILGFISEQDILRGLWSEEFNNDNQLLVSDLMQMQFTSVKKDQTIFDITEFFVVDKNKLFNVNDSGMLTSMNYQSYPERLRVAFSHNQAVMPVVENEKLIGMLSQNAIANFIAA